MAALSNYLENALLNHILRGQPYSAPDAVYIALYVSDPTDEDTGTEVSGGGYVRQKVTFSTPTDGRVTNVSDIIFPVATSDWGTITHVGIRDAATGGNLLFHAPLQVEKTIQSGDQFVIRAGSLQVTID